MIKGQIVEKAVPHQDNRYADRYFLYMPLNSATDAKTLIVIHGVGRGARSSAEQLVLLAERYGVILVAPLFSADRYPDYQSLGLTEQGERADQALERIVSDFISHTGSSADMLNLFGFSGGAQFVHRFAMAYPERVARLVAGSAGWYTFPDEDVPYPSGTRFSTSSTDRFMVQERFLKVPALVFVGERDTERGTNFCQSPEVDEQQGTTRVERGRRWIEAMQSAAKVRNLDTEYRYMIAPGAGHSLKECLALSDVGEISFHFLFGANGLLHNQ